MDYQTVKEKLHEMIDQVDDPEVLYAIRDILTSPLAPDFWDELPIEVQESIERGLQQAENGDVIPHEEVMKKYKKWLSK